MPIGHYKDLGPCSVIMNPDGTPAELNPTMGGVKMRDTLLFTKIVEDGMGESAVSGVDKGREVQLEVPMTRASIARLNLVIYGSELVGSTLTVKNTVGNDFYSLAKKILIKPLVNNIASITTSEWTHLWHCFPVVDQEIVYDNSEQRVAKILFEVYPSQDTARRGKFYQYGPD